MGIRSRVTVHAPFDQKYFEGLKNELTREFGDAVDWEEDEAMMKIEADRFSLPVTSPCPERVASIAAAFFPGHEVTTSWGFTCRFEEDSPVVRATQFLNKLRPDLD